MNTNDAIDLFVTSRHSKGLSKLTIKWYKIILGYLAVTYAELPTDPESLEKFIAASRGGDERRHGFYRTLKCFYRWLKRRRKIDNDPMELVEPPRRRRKAPRAMALDDFVKLLHYNHPPDIQAFLEFIADTGCRVGELANLRPGDIQHGPSGYVVRLNGKSGEHHVPISENTYRLIISHIPIPYKTAWLTRRISRAFKNAGIKGTAHTLRHTFATQWNGSEFALQTILGHSGFEILSHYRQLRVDQIAVQHNQYSLLKYLDKN